MIKPFDDDEPFTSSDGLVIFTADYLLQRGYCCGNGCRNCPYNYKAVPEPGRSRLIKARENTSSQS